MTYLNKAVFIDMQGTLGGEGFGDIMSFNFFPYSLNAIKLLNQCGILTIAVTNQSHIAKGHLTYDDFNKKISEIKVEMSKVGAFFNAVYCCPHGKEDGCLCKKPLTGMLEKAQQDFNICLKESYIIGDMGVNDILMAKSVGAKGILVRTGMGESSLTTFRHTWANVEADYIADNILEAVKWILEKEIC